jgi:hypothetical protein
MKYVGAQTYKDVSSTAQPGMPGAGDVRETTRSRDNRTRFMTTTEGGNTFEWAVFVPGTVGNILHARVNNKQEDVTRPYIHSWEDDEHEIRNTRMQLGYTPFVDDWANVYIVNKIAQL